VCRNEHGQSDESSDSPGLSSWDFAQGWFATAFQPRLLRVAPPSSEGREGMAGQRNQAIGWLMAADTAEVGRKADQAADVGEHPCRGGGPVENVGLASLTTPGHGRSGSTTIRTRSIAGFQRPHWSVGSQVTCSSSGRRMP
jgi:hypothetical protein